MNWYNAENITLFNPKMARDEAQARLDSLSPAVLSSFSGHVFLLSSGTTSDAAKWVALSKEAFLASAESVNQRLESNAKDTWLHLLPDFHVGGLAIRARATLSGAGVVEMSGWDLTAFVAAIQNKHITLISLVPAQIYDLCQASVSCPSSVRAVLVGGGALASALHGRAVELGWPIRMTYGMTETCSSVGISSVGGAPFEVLSHLELQLSADAGISTFKIRGSSLLTAYVIDGEIIDPKQEGWFHTQDRGELDLSSKRFRVLGRTTDFIKIGGESVEMSRLNQILEQVRVEFGGHKEFAPINPDFALLPVPDSRLGHVIHLATDTSLTTDQATLIIENYNRRVLPFERIRERHVLDLIPRTALGKLQVAACLQKIQSDLHYWSLHY